MKYLAAGAKTLFAGIGVLGLAACGGAADETATEEPVVEASSDPVAEAAGDQQPDLTGDQDEATVLAAQVCHDKVWMEDERFSNLPNAAVSIDPATLDDDNSAIGWTVEWDDPQVSASGTCSVDGSTLTVLEG